MANKRTILLATLATLHHTNAQNEWYPDWQGGGGTCLENTADPAPSYMRIAKTYFETDLEKCCVRYYNWDKISCLVAGGSTAPTGSSDWYADYATSLCVQDCAIAASAPTCGGLATSSDELHPTAALCCTGKFSGSASCAAESAGQTYGGSDEWYKDPDSNGKCVQDCAGADPCGGVVTDTWTPTYATVQQCCAGQLSSLDANQCYSDSTPTSTGTDKWYADSNNGKCLEDNDVSPGVRIPAGTDVGTLYDTFELCCSGALSWIQTDYCESRSDTSATDYPYSNKWFVNYQDAVCVLDCDASATGADPACGSLTDKNMELYADAAACCAAKLSYINKDACALVSAGGTSAAAVGTYQWYADFSTDQQCVQDCDTVVANTCDQPGGILATASGNTLYADATKCCQAKFGWMNEDLCVAKSTGADSDLFYVDYQKNGCVKDCDASGGGACGGPPSDGSTQMFTTAELCCKEKLSYVRDVICIANTNNAAAEGSEEWFVDYQENICVQDCAVDAAKPGCAGVLKDSSTATYASAEACCVAKLGWIDKTSCTVKSTGGTAAPDTGSEKWYVDYQSNSCAQDCELDATNTATCTSPGKILSVTDTQTLYDDATACCKAKLSWMSEDLCVALSSGVFSDLFYVDYQNNKCQQDCDSTAAGAAASCTGHPTDMSVAMYATAAECCKGSLGWLSEDICVGNTNDVAPTGSLKWWVDWSVSKCVKDCPESATDAECGGLKNFWDSTYDSSAACCSARFAWMDPDDCVV